MRIVIDYTPAVHQAAGIGRHTRGLIAALAPLATDHQVTLVVYGRSQGADVEPPPNFQLRVVPLSNRWLSLGWHRLGIPLAAEWLSGPADLYHASDFVLPPLRQAQGILTVHDLSFLTVPDCAEASLRSYLTRVVPRSVARADHLLADSMSTKRDLMQLLDVPADSITVVYPGVEPRFRPVDDPVHLAQVRDRYAVGDGPFILGVGTLEPRKNWSGLIRAWTRLRHETKLPHRLVIAGGRGWLYREIFDTAQASGLQEQIVFTGFVDDADLPALYSAAQAFALPSRYEGFGIPVVEAMACGTPVVCADNSSLPEAAGDAALLVDAADEAGLAAALQRLLEDGGLRAERRERGLRQAKRFAWRSSAETLLATYEQVGRG